VLYLQCEITLRFRFNYLGLYWLEKTGIRLGFFVRVYLEISNRIDDDRGTPVGNPQLDPDFLLKQPD
jgi:hypothetical protein